MTVFTAQKIQ